MGFIDDCLHYISVYLCFEPSYVCIYHCVFVYVHLCTYLSIMQTTLSSLNVISIPSVICYADDITEEADALFIKTRGITVFS